MFRHSFNSTILTNLKDPSLELSTNSSPLPKICSHSEPCDYKKRYITQNKIIGEGSSCIVKTCRRITDGKEFAVKIISKNNVRDKTLLWLKQEITILKTLKNNKYVVDLIDSYETNKTIYLVLELCQRDTLFEYIKNHFSKKTNRYFCDEYEMGYIFYQIIRGIHLMHKKNIVHRDLKLENILIKKTKNDINILISDFGLSHIGKNKMNDKCGSPHYIPTEFFYQDTYNSKCDWWAAGVMLYVMLSGTYPFEAESNFDLFCQIKDCNFNFKNPDWLKISIEAKHLITKLLNPNPKKRFSYNEIINHPFMKKVINIYKHY